MPDDKSFFQDLTDKIKNAYKDMYVGLDELIKGLDENASRVVGAMGQSRFYAEGIRQSLSLAVPELQEISKEGNGFADAMSKAMAAQTAILDALNTNIMLTDKQMISIAQVTAAYGLQSESVKAIAEGFADIGMSINQFPKSLETAANNARAVGVNVGAVMSNIQIGLRDFNSYGFEDGVEGLGRMAAKAAAMRIDMKSIFTFAENVFTPEKAISTVATFQRLGMAVGDLADPFRLMYLASEDVEELQNQVAKATQGFTFFNEKTKKFELYPNAKRDIREIDNATNLGYDNIVKMSQAAERLRIVGKDLKVGSVDEETKQFIANIAQYDEKKGGFAVKLNMQGDTKLVSQINKEDIESIKEANKEMSAKEIAEAQMSTSSKIAADVAAIKAAVTAPLAGTRVVSSTFEVLRGAAGTARAAVRETFEPRKYQESVNKSIEGGLMSINDLLTGKAGFSDILKKMGSFGTDFTKGLENLAIKLVNFPYAQEFKKDIMPGNVYSQLGGTLTEQMSNALQPLLKSFGLDGKNLTQTINQNTNLKVENIKVDVSGQVNMVGKDEKPIAITPELQKYVQDVVKKQLDQLVPKPQMSLKPNQTTQ